MEQQKIFGHGLCRLCDEPVLNEILWKTNGLCAPHFRAGANRLFVDVIAHHATGERVRLSIVSSKRSPGERRRRRSLPKRERSDHERKVRSASNAALRRLRDLYPGVYEVILADERAERGLEAWTIERAVSPHHAGSHFAELAAYAGADDPMAS